MAPKMKAKAQIEPLGDRIMVKPIEQDDVSKGGIIIPEMAKEKSQEGEVVAVGAGRVTDAGVLIPTKLKVGDRVLFGKYSGTELTVAGESVLLVRESEIMAIVHE